MKTHPDQLSPESDRQIDSIVEDLAQQDVLPIDEGSPDASDPLSSLRTDELTSFGQAGSWDEPIGGEGQRARRIPLEDETKAADLLARRGVTEAADELNEIEEEEVAAEEAAEES